MVLVPQALSYLQLEIYPSSPKAEMFFKFLIGVPVTPGILHKWVVNPLHSLRPGGPGCIFQPGLCPAHLVSSKLHLSMSLLLCVIVVNDLMCDTGMHGNSWEARVRQKPCWSMFPCSVTFNLNGDNTTSMM